MKHRGKRGRMLELVASSRGLTLHEFREKIGREQQRRDDLLKRLGIDKASLDAALAGSHGQELSKCRRLIETCGGVLNVLDQGHAQNEAGMPDAYCQMPCWLWRETNKIVGQGLGGRLVRVATRALTWLWIWDMGHRFWLEVKVGGDELRRAQRDFIERECLSGGVVIVGNCNDLQRYFQRLGVLR